MIRLAALLLAAILLAIPAPALAQGPGQSPGDNATDMQQDPGVLFASAVAAMVMQAWKAPAGMHDLAETHLLKLKLAFDGAGALVETRVTRPSGHADFDASALEAVSRANATGLFGPPPGGQPFAFTLEFNSKEQPQ